MIINFSKKRTNAVVKFFKCSLHSQQQKSNTDCNLYFVKKKQKYSGFLIIFLQLWVLISIVYIYNITIQGIYLSLIHICHVWFSIPIFSINYFKKTCTQFKIFAQTFSDFGYIPHITHLGSRPCQYVFRHLFIDNKTRKKTKHFPTSVYWTLFFSLMSRIISTSLATSFWEGLLPCM